MRRWGIPVLRIALGTVFLWFGALKLAGVSPVVGLIRETYGFLPQEVFLPVLGVWEVAIGLGLLTRRMLRTTLALLWLQMLGTFGSFLFAPGMFFNHGNLLLLSTEGEFVIKNLVLVAASIVLGGHEVSSRLENRG